MKIVEIVSALTLALTVQSGAATSSISKLRGGSQQGVIGASPTKLWVVNNCPVVTTVYYGDQSLPLSSEFLQAGGATLGELEGKNTAMWVDAPNRDGCVTNNCNDAGRTLAELNFNEDGLGEDWWDISLVKGFNVGVSIEVIGKMENKLNPQTITCADAYCMDAFMLCDTAPHNVKGGAPNWGNKVDQGLTYKVTFCPSGANTKNNDELQKREELQQKQSRYQMSPMPEKVWCNCAWKKAPGRNVVDGNSYTQFTGQNCGAI
jgi:hypothetical protein